MLKYWHGQQNTVDVGGTVIRQIPKQPEQCANRNLLRKSLVLKHANIFTKLTHFSTATIPNNASTTD
jgi:hypothetical protein